MIAVPAILPRPRTAVTVAVAGLLLVFLDLRPRGFDVLLDPVGWVVTAAGLRRLREYGDWFPTAAFAAWVSALFALPDMLYPVRAARAVAAPQGLQGLLVAAYDLVTVVAVVLVAVAVWSAATEARETDAARRFRTLAVALAVVPGLSAIAGLATIDVAPDAALVTLLVVLVLAGRLVIAWFVVELFRRRNCAWLGGPEAAGAPATG